MEDLRSRTGGEQEALARVVISLVMGFWSVVLEERNAVVIERVKEILARDERPRSIAIFYGAAHMPLFERQLEELGYAPAGDLERVKAWAMDAVRR